MPDQVAEQEQSLVVEMKEWSTKLLPGVSLSPSERILTKQLRKQGKIRIEEMRAGLRITTKSCVGVVRLGEREIRVQPKLSGDNLRVMEMIGLTGGLDLLRIVSTSREIDSDGQSLLDLFSMLLTREVERLVRGGLITDYAEREDELPVLRGRLLVKEQVLNRFGQVDRVFCRFDERESDIAENQLLAVALRLCSRLTKHQRVKRQSRQLFHVISQVCVADRFDTDLGDKQIVYNRRNETYRFAHEICWLIIRLCGIRDMFSSQGIRSFAFLLDMNALFEQFVAVVIRRVLSTDKWRVSKQHISRSIIWDADSNKPYSDVRPDLLLQHRVLPQRLALDSKYKLYDERKVSSADVYQTFLYAFGFQHPQSPNDLKRSVLIYPKETSATDVRELTIRSPTNSSLAKLSLLGIHVPSLLDEMQHGVLGSQSRLIAEVIEGY